MGDCHQRWCEGEVGSAGGLPLIDQIGRLFDIEMAAAVREIYGTDTHRDLRQAEARPIVDDLF